MKIARGLLLRPTLCLLNWILRHRNGNSLIIGGPLGWSWVATLDTTHHGSLAGPANAHRHSDLANIGIDDHHARDHASRHQDGGADEINIAGLSGVLADRQKSKVGDNTLGWTLNKLLKGAGAGVNPTEIDVPAAGIWTLLETLSPVNVASISSSILTAYDMFMIVYRLEVLNTGVSAALCMRFNNDAGNNYTRLLLDMSAAPPVWYCWAADKFKLSQHYSANKYGAGVVYFPGNLGASQIPIATSSGFVYTSYHWIAAGKYSASANITTITFLGEGTNITGKIAIFGRNF